MGNLWNTPAGREAFTELANPTEEELQAGLKAIDTPEHRAKLKRRLAPYRTKVTWEALMRPLGGYGAFALIALLVLGCERRIEPTMEPDPLDWPHVPLRVAGVDDAGGRSLKSAVKVWNDVGCNLFVLVGSEADADVLVDYDAPPAGTDCARQCDTRRHAACTCYAPAKQQWRIFYPSPSTIDVDWWVWTHELGHVIGLAHDVGWRMSPMRPDASKGPGDSSMLRVTDADRKAVRRLRCP